jgi:hypothetical protein
VASDQVIGIAANSTDQPSAAKIANLDVYQQGVPTIFGFQLQLSLSATVNIVGAMDHPFNHLLWLLVNGDTQRASSAILESCDLERQVRDVQAAVKHVAMSPNFFIAAGRVRLGLDPARRGSNEGLDPWINSWLGARSSGATHPILSRRHGQ